MSTQSLALARPSNCSSAIAAMFLKVLYALMSSAHYVFLLALSAMLFRPPDLQTFPIDRVAFALLIAVSCMQSLLRCGRFRMYPASWPMLVLLILGLCGTVFQPYDSKAWSVLAAQWIVPVAMFHLSGTVFSTSQQQRKLEWFSIAVLLYLALIAVFWLLDLKWLIFPRYILDESIGIHADRARGPFLQAVANGVCINVLAIVALHASDRRSAKLPHVPRLSRAGFLAVLLLVVTPVALLATKTRAVWIAAAVSAGLVILWARGRRSRIAVAAVVLSTAVVMLFARLLQTSPGELIDRLQERSPVEFRVAMYRTGWQMFTEKPLLGWRSEADIQPEIEKRLSNFHPDYYVLHNTYLQLAVQHGAIGVVLYLWLCVAFFRFGTGARFTQPPRESPFGPEFGLMWRVMLCVYLLNASAVVMNYQFLNGYMFTIAGILAAQEKTGEVGVRP